MRFKKAAAAAVAIAGLLTACSAVGNPLSGTTWKGGNMLDSNVVFQFKSSTDCSISTSFMGSGPCTYKLDGQQAVITYKGTTYAFQFQGSQMQGNLLGAGVQLVKQ